MSKKVFARLYSFRLGAKAENVARALTKLLARIDSFISIIINYFCRKITEIGF